MHKGRVKKNLENYPHFVDKGGGRVVAMFGSFITYLVVSSLYLAVTMRKKSKKVK